MHAFEFTAKPKNGCIQIPAEYQDKVSGNVRVIILSQDQSRSSSNLIEHLLAQPMEIEHFIPFSRSDIYERQ